MQTIRRFHILGMVFLFVLFSGLQAFAGSQTFQNLQQRLIQDGFPADRVQAIFSMPGVAFEKTGVSAYFIHNEAKLDYQQFTRPEQIAAASAYMVIHQSALDAAEAQYGVDKAVITAIILVETRLGTYTGNKSVINTLSTLSVMAEPAPREDIWAALPTDSRRISRDAFEKKADQKAAWAYRELKAFLSYTEQEKLNPTAIKGSYAGAMGICQFMPSNIPLFAKDGNNDGRINLFVHADAIHSIAAYLKNYGWAPGISRKAQSDAVYHYNHSQYYVDTILQIMDQLKETPV
ncbi:lytic murein transglycosylase [Desulfosarcina sp. OttesenSCG-928-A07]|nr:lytic murein transglycosylase [Desulfosarcina sp. OttesenSCG-928-G17]MDL2329334.1 lytic murein transglycosylase [Desulfosarcina sp. OttesenSCG-928-A07]